MALFGPSLTVGGGYYASLFTLGVCLRYLWERF